MTGEDVIKGNDLIHIEAGEIMLSPDKDVERTRMYVCGSTGSGKSFVAQYCEQYHTTFKNNPIFQVSENDEDPAFDKKDYIKRIDSPTPQATRMTPGASDRPPGLDKCSGPPPSP